ncbi:hypothetical protein VKT23_017059 [Stygiomarasmius scandens]|uniref:DUF6535 domain-containing protein n=1 Tax=Marasmiellus scandens TaxID=2682957 RepID=A0ABR1IX96_9AGAR
MSLPSPSRSNSAMVNSSGSWPGRDESPQDPQEARASSVDSVRGQDAEDVKGNNGQRPVHSRNPVKEQNRGTLLNMLGDRSSYTGNRDYDYEKKYPPDPYGEEAGEDARIWKAYLDEAEAYDDEMLRGFRDTINSLLVFAALFSAVVTTFVVQTSQALLPDYGYITAGQLIEQNLLLRAAGNVTAINSIPPSPVGIDTVSFSNTDVWINGLFFTSLSLSLATALLSVLANQWLQAYTSLISGSARERAMIRQFRFTGFKKWKMREIIGMLPIILHLSLAVFFIGLALFVSELQHRSVSLIVVIIAAISFGMYLGSAIIPVIWIGCPYRVPVLFVPTQYIFFSIHIVIYPLRAAYWSLLHLLAQHDTLYQLPYHVQEFGSSDTRPTWPSFPPGSLKSTELQWLKRKDNLGRVISDAFVWLSTLESNRSIQRITVQGLHGIIYDRSKYGSFMDLDSTCFRRIFEKSAFSIGDYVWGRYCGVDLSMIDKTVFHDDLGNVSRRIQVEEIVLGKSSIEESRVSYLVEAARKGDPSIVRGMLELWDETDIGSENPRGETALIAASEQGNFDIVKLLIDRGADVNAVHTWPGHNPLRAALQKKHIDVAKLLIQSGADVNKFNLLLDSIERGELDMVKFLMQEGASHESILHTAAACGKVDIVQFLLEEGVDINARDASGASPLQEVASEGEEAVIKLLVEKGADVNAEGGPFGTALQTAAYWGRLGTVELLIEKGADVNAKAGEKGTALEAAAHEGHLDVMRVLLENCADVNAKGGKYGSVIQAARAPSFWVPEETMNSIIDLLHQHGATD